MTLLSKKNESKLKTDKGSTTAILKDWNKTKKLLSEVLIQSSDFMCQTDKILIKAILA